MKIDLEIIQRLDFIELHDKQRYKKLLKKLEDTGGKIYIKEGKVYTEGGKLKNP